MTMTTYEDYLRSLNLKHFQPHEVLSYADQVRHGVKNSLPPRELWANIAPTLYLLDLLRAKLGKPITLTSIYRNPQYNKKVGGEPASFHMQNKAVDFQVKGMTPAAVSKVLKEMRAAGTFKGGIGTYPTFVHVDTRGVNATW